MTRAYYDHKRRAQVAAGTWSPPVPASTVQQHVDFLVEEGMSRAHIAAVAGVGERTVRGLRDQRTVQAGTAAAILAVRTQPKPVRADLVPRFGTARRIQALAALGWSCSEQGRHLHMPAQMVWLIAQERTPFVYESTRNRVNDLFERLSGTPGPSRRSRNAAARHGWLPPLAWEDIDDPDATPSLGDEGVDIVDEFAVDRALAGERVTLSDTELIAALQTGVARGESLSRLSLRLGINYAGAKTLLGGELTPNRAKRAERQRAAS
jgi:hypothetical protein